MADSLICTTFPTPSASAAGQPVLNRRLRNGAWVVTVGGPLGVQQLPPLRHALQECLAEDRRSLVLDLSATHSAAHPELLALLGEFRSQTAVYAAGAPTALRSLLEGAADGTGVRVAGSLGEALDAAGPAAPGACP
ncbi:hypothetical protein [Streptomyces sp. NPDC005805]|uniref:hypothetical protein n=1 Tax=Streptomyces sp. NPDC005805 TaxID=3157068 RepID=UPI0033C20618